MTIQYLSSKRIQGLSSDTKPTNVPNNTEFIETDTGSVYKVTSGTWSIFKSAMPKGDFYYFIYYSGTQYEALNGKTGVIDYTNTTDFANVLNSAITAVSTAGGGLIHLSNGTLLTRSIIIPKNNVRIEGQGESTIIKQDATQNLAAMFKGLNFDTLTGGGTNGGVESFYMSYLVIDGNKSNNVTTATDGIIFYGYNWKFDHVHIRHMRGRGIYSEWQSAGGLVPNSLTSMEAHYSHLKIHDCETIGWVNRGPHDWEGEHITIYDCGSHGYVQEYSAGVYSGSGYVDNMHIFACDGIYAAWIKGGTLHYANLTTETSGNGTPGAGGIGLYVDGGAVYGTGLWCYAEDRGVVFNTGGFCVCEASHIENCYDSGVEISKSDVIFDGYVANNGEKGIIVGSASVAIANVRITGTSMGHTQAQVDWANAGNSSVAGFLSIYTNSTNTVGILNENNINIDTNSLTYENQADGTAVRAFDGRPMTARTTAKSPFSRKFGQLFAGHSATVTQGLYMGVTETGTKTYVNDQWWGIVINYNTGTTANSKFGY